MQVKEAIIKRKSIRKYLDKPVSEEIINELIEAARLSPSAYNSQPWKFKLVYDKRMINDLKENNIFKNDFVYAVPLIIVCCGDLSCYPERARENFELKELALIDISIASQSLVLRATELGLGTCYVGLLNRDKLKKILNIPEKYILPYVITLGYPDLSEETRGPGRKDKSEVVL